MRKPQIWLIALASLAILGSGCKKDEDSAGGVSSSELDKELEALLIEAADNQDITFFMLPASNDYTSIPQDPKNPMTAEKVALGKLLFHETGMSSAPMKDIGKGTYACASCHFASAGFTSGNYQAIGDGGVGFGVNGEGRLKSTLYEDNLPDAPPIRTPSLLNNAYQQNSMWNGMFGATYANEGTESQWAAGGPLEANFLGFEGTETQAIAAMVGHRVPVDTNFLKTTGYYPLFDAAFPDYPVTQRYNNLTAGLAIAAFERTLLPNEAPFQKWLMGDSDAMTAQQKRGAVIFFGKAACTNCHTGPGFNNNEFHAMGMNDLYMVEETTIIANAESNENKGRAGFTGKDEDLFKFKVPQLYNLKDNGFLGHGSSKRSVRDFIVYLNNGVKENPNVPDSQLSDHFTPLNLTDTEIDDITIFIEDALHDPNLKRYQPESILSGNCFPFNDPLARDQLGCD